MTTNNGAPASALARVIAGIAAVTPDQYVTPCLPRVAVQGYVPANDGAQVSDEVKRIFSYRHAIISKLLELDGAAEKLDAYVNVTPEPDDANERYQAYMKEGGALNDEKNVLDALLWAQIRSESPELHLSENVCIVDDWTVGIGAPRWLGGVIIVGSGMAGGLGTTLADALGLHGPKTVH